MSATRQFGSYASQPTAEASYQEGYASGLKWKDKDNWIPGGPHFYRASFNQSNKDWVAFCAASEENNREWLRGWHDGNKRKSTHKRSERL